MLKLWIIGAVAGIAIAMLGGSFGATEVSADNGPHVRGAPMTTSACAGCHRAHTAQGAYLLKTDEMSLCTSCHDGTVASTNVLDGMTTTGGALRAGGFNNAAIDTDDQTWRFSEVIGGTRVAFCGSGAAIPDPPTTCVDASGGVPGGFDYANPGSWPLTILPNTDPVTGALVTAPTTSKHTLEVAGQTVWGSGMHNPLGDGSAFAGATAATLECSSCHNPHGNGQYRILRPNPATMLGVVNADGVTDFDGTFPDGVTVPDDCPRDGTGAIISQTACTNGSSGSVHNYTTPNYMYNTYVTWTTGTIDGGLTGKLDPITGAPLIPTAADGISAWCAQCHSRYLARIAYATDSGDAIFTYRHSTTGGYAYNGRQCNTCHVAHGTNALSTGASAGVTWPDGTAKVGANAGSALLKMDNRGMCLKCHKR